MAQPRDRLFYIRSRMCGHCLDVAQINEDPGAKIWTWHIMPHIANNQLWYEDHSTGTIRSMLNHFALDCDGNISNL